MVASLTPLRLLRIIQLVFALGLIGVSVLMLGPFQGMEEHLGLSDKEAHAMAFYTLTTGLFLCAPRSRRTDLALAVFGFGALIEIVQGAVGRSMSLWDLMADGAGVAAALLPGIVERLRHHVRTSPDLSFADIEQRDRRAAKAPALGAVPERA